jgi:hypothetical protein
MPTGPEGEKRRPDVIGNAVKIARIATGEDDDVPAPDCGKNSAAMAGEEGWRGPGQGYDAGSSGGDCKGGGGEAVGKIALAAHVAFLYIK